MPDLSPRDTRGWNALRHLRAAARSYQACRPQFESRLVWILGSPRSGSTWLMQMLRQHQAVVGINEPLIGWYLGPFLSDLPGGHAPDLDTARFTIRLAQAAKPSQFFAEQYSDVWLPGLARMMKERFYAHAVREDLPTPPAQRVVAIKEPNGSQSADLLMRALPRSRLLFLLRDGRDVVDSELAANLQDSWVSREFPGLRGISESERLDFVVQSAYKWRWRTEVVQEAARHHPGPTRVLRYEDLLRNTAAELRETLEWCGLAATASQIRAWTESNSFDRLSGGRTGSTEFFRSADPGAWRRNLREDEQRAVQQILGPKLHELGYETTSGAVSG